MALSADFKLVTLFYMRHNGFIRQPTVKTTSQLATNKSDRDLERTKPVNWKLEIGTMNY